MIIAEQLKTIRNILLVVSIINNIDFVKLYVFAFSQR